MYCALFWIQGKTSSLSSDGCNRLYCALFWIQGKTFPAWLSCPVDCTVPYFGFKAKLSHNRLAQRGIVLCLILDSRQNFLYHLTVNDLLYCALFWIQGKTYKGTGGTGCDCTVPYFGFKAKPGLDVERNYPDCTVPYFGFKAKPQGRIARLGANCTVPYFGFKAKHSLSSNRQRFNCTVPYFGFKAKHKSINISAYRYCTVPYFGFKAKRDMQTVLRRSNCTVPYFGFKAKQKRREDTTTTIVLCLILDSRQNSERK